MNRKACVYICLFVNLSWISLLQAEPTEGLLSLHNALEIAYQQNPRMRMARKSVASAKGDLITVKSWANPEIEAEIGGLRKNDDGDREPNLDTLSIEQPFDPPGVRSLSKKIGTNEIEIQKSRVQEVWSGVYVEIRSVYAKLILNQKELELNRNNLKSIRQFFSDIQVRYQSGQALKNHVQRAKIELFKAESDYLMIENELDIDRARMNLLLGRGPDTLFEVQDELKEEHLKINLDELIQIALANRPDMTIQEILLDSKTREVRKEKLSRLPSYSLGFQMTNEDSEKDYAAVVKMSLPIWDLNEGKIKKTKAERDAQEIKLQVIKNEIVFEVYAAYKDAQLAIKQLGLYKQSLSEANEMFLLAGLRYGEGRIDFLDYLDQLQASIDSRTQYYRGLYQLNQNINSLEKSIHSSLRGEVFLQ